jgi:hypothetical protein
MLKRGLAVQTWSLDESKMKLEGVTGTVTKDNFARAFHRWLERFEKWVHISNRCIKKS